MDGNTDGNYMAGSVTHTNGEVRPWWQVDLGSVRALDRIEVWNRADCCAERLMDFYVLVSDAPFTSTDLDAALSQASVASYRTTGQGGRPTTVQVSRTGRYVRVQLASAGTGILSLAEVKVWGADTLTTSQGADVRWLVADQLGTPRMVVDKTGSLAGVTRHDYLPFGEELGAAIGGRTTNQGYSRPDGVRNRFTGKERDDEAGLDYFLARYYSSSQGRFTSPDEFTGGPDELYYFVDNASANPTFYADLTKPQSLNKYQYAYNNPLRYIDPDGHDVEFENERLEQQFQTIANESKSFADEITALKADHNVVVVVVERGLKTNDEKSSGDAKVTFNTDGSSRVVIAVDSHGRTSDSTKEHEVGHARDVRTNREQFRKDALKTQKNKGGPGEKPHDDRPEEKRANAFRDQVERERKEYRKQQEAERKRKKQEKNRQ